MLQNPAKLSAGKTTLFFRAQFCVLSPSHRNPIICCLGLSFAGFRQCTETRTTCKCQYDALATVCFLGAAWHARVADRRLLSSLRWVCRGCHGRPQVASLQANALALLSLCCLRMVSWKVVRLQGGCCVDASIRQLKAIDSQCPKILQH